MKYRRLQACTFALALGAATLSCSGSQVEPGAEDVPLGTSSSALEATTDDLNWVASVLPVLLGRRARGPGELLALSNAAALRGRQSVLRTLMDSDEFAERWTGFFLERFRIGRDPGSDWYFSSCYETPRSGGRDGWISAAQTVRDHRPMTPQASSTETFNMADVVRGSIAMDDVFPAYRGYLFTLVQRGSRETPEDIQQAQRGELFTQAFIDRSPVCMECHHTGASMSGPARSYLLPAGSIPFTSAIPRYESLVFPSYTYTPAGRSFVPTRWATSFASAQASGGSYPFPGWNGACGRLTSDATPSDTAIGPNGLVRWSGATPTVWKVDAALYEGVRSFPTPTFAPLDTGPRVTAYWLAASFANDVWREVMGHSLKIANYLSRNEEQHNRLSRLTNTVPVSGWPGRYSLRRVLSDIVMSREFNAAVTDRAPKLFEPFMESGGPSSAPSGDWMGDRIHRYSADILFRSAAHSLGRPRPTHFPQATGTLPSLSQAKAQGMGLSPDLRESPSPSLDGMLGWEDTVGRQATATLPPGICKATPGRRDWIDALVSYADARPALRTRDVVDALKFRLMNLPTLSLEERTAIESVLGRASLDEPFASRVRFPDDDPLVSGLRALCGLFLKTPEFMLGGAKSGSYALAGDMPIQLGNIDGAGAATEESETRACQTWGLDRDALYTCDPQVRASFRLLWEELKQICPRGSCFFHEVMIPLPPVCLSCWQALLTERPPREIDPRQKAGFGGEPVPSYIANGGVFLAYAPKAKIVALSKPLALTRANGKLEQAALGAVLEEGDSIELPPGVFVKIEDSAGKIFQTPASGLTQAPNKGVWTFMATGPVSIEPLKGPAPAQWNPMSQAELDALAQSKADAARNDVPGSVSLVHTVTAPVGNSSFIDDPAANDRPDMVLIASPRAPSTANPRNIGVWYDAGRKRWAVYNESKASMPAGASFSVRALPPGASAFVHRASPATLSGHMTYLGHPSLDGRPEVSFQVTHVYNPPGAPGIYDDHPIGVWYDTGSKRWAIYNEDFAAMPASVSFNVKIGGNAIVVADASNLVKGGIVLDSPETNGRPDAKLFVTHNWNPPGASTAYYTRPFGTRYDSFTGRWSVFGLDGSPIPAGVGFNVHRGY